jgi:hypothetical protein
LDKKRIFAFEQALNRFTLAGPKGLESQKLLGCGRDIDRFSVTGRHIDDDWLDARNVRVMSRYLSM